MKSTLNFLDKYIGYIVGFIAFIFSTTLFTGMAPWLIGKGGKYGGTVTSVFTTVLMIHLRYKQVDIDGSAMMLIIITSFFIGVGLVYFGENFFLKVGGPRKKHTGEKVWFDFNETTIDEFHGMLIAMLPIYFFKLELNQFIFLQLLALICFRFFDIKKPWLVKKIENAWEDLTQPVAIMLDDTAAGAMSAIIVLIASVITVNFF